MNHEERYDVERQERWRDFGGQTMPMLSFPVGWKVQMIAPFGGVLARFIVELPSGNSKSIYFDAHDAAGCVGEPYWEVYPYRDDCGRCMLDEADRLIQMIGDEQPREPYEA